MPETRYYKALHAVLPKSLSLQTLRPMSNKVKITITGADKKEVVVNFSNLNISQRLCDVNSFSFIWRIQQEQDVTLSTHKAFYENNLGASVLIEIDQKFVFKGYIQTINCYNQFMHNVEYEISGSGLAMKLDIVPNCNSWMGKSLKDIVSKVDKASLVKNEPTCSDSLYFTVQYNQTPFSFLCMMAARHGQWFFYNGEQMMLGKPEGIGKPEVVPLGESSVFNLNLTARMFKPPVSAKGFDAYKGELTEHNKAVAAYGGTGLVDAGVKGGNTVYEEQEHTAHYANSATQDLMIKENELHQHAHAASSTFITANSYLAQIKLGHVIQIEEVNKSIAGAFIVTEIYHSSQGVNNYQNHFTAIPAENIAPPYTNPNLYAVSKPQPATVKFNEDKDGLARVKVHFPWQAKDETSPWLSVIVPHAGNGKGFRFLPEVDDEVMIDFVNNNAERPFVMGAVYSEKNKSGVPADGNDVKIIGSRSGRMMVINDKQGSLQIVDNVFEKDEYGLDQTKNPNNCIALGRIGDGEDEIFLSIGSNKDDDNSSYIQFTNGKEINMALISGGDNIASLQFSKDGKKITIKSKGSINLAAEGAINLNAGEINMDAKKINVNASDTLSLKGTSGIEATGMKIDMAADTDIALSGVNATVNANAKLTLAGGGMAELNAALVKIN